MGTEEAVAAGMVGGMVFGMVAASFVICVLLIIARWKIFTKAGEAGWKSIIPVYADYVQWRIGWKKTNLFWVMFGLVFLGYILMIMGGMPIQNTVTTDAMTVATTTTNTPLMGIGSLLCIAGVILDLIAVYKLFQSFGWGAGMFVLYIFFAPIIMMVLGFGSQRWLGAVD